MERDFVGYGPDTPSFRWPGGARVAVNFVINYEEGSELGAMPGDTVRETQSEAVYPARLDERELVNESLFEYGSRVGVWRVLRILDKYDATATVFACAVALERNPKVAEAFVARGFDMVGHGYRWISHYGMNEEEERRQIRLARESIERTTGQKITGWFLRPMATTNTRRILVEEGFTYDCYSFNDDIPYFVTVNDRRMLIVPYTLDNNDIRFVKNQLFTADQFFTYLRDAFDILYEESAESGKLMSVGLHPRVIGRQGRAIGLDRFLAHVKQFPDVWIANRNSIARFWTERFG